MAAAEQRRPPGAATIGASELAQASLCERQWLYDRRAGATGDQLRRWRLNEGRRVHVLCHRAAVAEIAAAGGAPAPAWRPLLDRLWRWLRGHA